MREAFLIWLIAFTTILGCAAIAYGLNQWEQSRCATYSLPSR